MKEKLERSGAAADAVAESLIAPCPLKTAWIEIVLLGEDGQGIADEAYVLELPDGEVRRGKLDATGRARVDGIAEGTCTVRFPNLDEHAWR
jgi:hypothetical protein